MNLTKEEKVNYMRIGLALAKVNVDNFTAEMIVDTYEGILQKGGDFSIFDSAKIEAVLEEKYKKKDE
jgi:hypothetical protein